MNLDLDPRRRTAARNGAAIHLGPTEFRILELLVGAPDGVGREGLYERVFFSRDDGGPGDDSFNVTISTLRRKLAVLGLRIPRCDRWGGLYRIEVSPSGFELEVVHLLQDAEKKR
ncbi:MAG TPA: winged helix-turn-helix domain-containing protein [Xanthobacteraceae bacterium]